MLVEANIEEARWTAIGLEALAERASCAALVHLGHDPAHFEISLLACDDARIRALNAAFRGQDKPTNVLSWPACDLAPAQEGEAPDPPLPGAPDAPEALGDIAIAFDTCAREAAQQGKALEDHAAHLVVHSVLHLLGFDHMREGDARLMETSETEILAKLGIADPYAEGSAAPDGVA